LLEDESDCVGKVAQALLPRAPLAVCAGDFGAVGDVPVALVFDHGREFVVHPFSMVAGAGGGSIAMASDLA